MHCDSRQRFDADSARRDNGAAGLICAGRTTKMQ